ncbi:hypothetical protein SLS60_000060 [Paraconiothyrium brasiliense]|uniref:Enoyl reductase (ER) domain-containing protein n=1 Tax=Paraconiothyrium brasiliense TaxID=300254 RepID=A0ABR3S570_9PLEO
MKAAQWDPAQQKVVVNEVSKPTPGPGQFLVKLASASLCHSDLMSMAMPHKEPITIGHEGAGYIEEIHPEAENKGFKVGDGIGFTYISGQWLAVIGCGGLGQLAVQYAKAMGLKVIGIDINDEILATAKSQGADAVFNSRTDPNYAKEAKAYMDRGPNKGADAVAVFSAATAAYKSAPLIVKLGGLIMVVGLSTEGVTFNALDIATGKYRVKGDSTGIPRRMKKAIDFTAKHGIKPEIETHKSLEAVKGMVERMRNGEVTRRQVVQFA